MGNVIRRTRTVFEPYGGNWRRNAFPRGTFDFGSFYPCGGDGSHCMTGEDQGAGYNINVPWEHGQCGDVDYLAVWDHILIPVTETYNPEIILISAGFDAAMGDPLGGCCLTPFGYSLMLTKVEGMSEPCLGARDKSSPKDVKWKSVPHRLFFARSHSNAWGDGGVAFLNPESSSNDKTYMRCYRITLEQFNDVLIQENLNYKSFESPLVDCHDMEFLVKNRSMCVESIKDGWYSNVLYLGELDGIPILTMTYVFCG
ncbi:Histone deacetylase 5 [Platanthera guangdongensis]|uniref:Histone deacetylase 5 n=1 Tax=Platanthera guangdongensis TaxID=2320717 RepID=A0ABR2LDH6_9ASPA